MSAVSGSGPTAVSDSHSSVSSPSSSVPSVGPSLSLHNAYGNRLVIRVNHDFTAAPEASVDHCVVGEGTFKPSKGSFMQASHFLPNESAQSWMFCATKLEPETTYVFSVKLAGHQDAMIGVFPTLSRGEAVFRERSYLEGRLRSERALDLESSPEAENLRLSTELARVKEELRLLKQETERRQQERSSRLQTMQATTNTRNEAIGVLVQEAMKAEDALKTMLATMAVSGDKESRLIEYEDILNIYQDSQKQTVVSSNSSVPGESVSAMLQGEVESLQATNARVMEDYEALVQEVAILREQVEKASRPGVIERQALLQRQDNVDALVRDAKQAQSAARRVFVMLQDQLKWAKRNGTVGSLEGIVALLQAEVDEIDRNAAEVYQAYDTQMQEMRALLLHWQEDIETANSVSADAKAAEAKLSELYSELDTQRMTAELASKALEEEIREHGVATKQIAEQRGVIQALTTDKATLQAQVTALTSEWDREKKENKVKFASLESLNKATNDLAAASERDRVELSSVKDQLARQKTEAASLFRDKTALASQVASLSKELESLKSSTASSAKAEADLTRLVSERDAVNSKLATELTQANADFVRVSKSLDECMARCQALALDNDRLQTAVTQTRQTLESQLSELRAERDRLVAEANVRPVRTAMSSPDPAGSPLPSRTPSERDAGRIRRLTEQISQLQEWYTVSVLREFFDKEGMRAMTIAGVDLFFELTRMGFEDESVQRFIAGHSNKAFLAEYLANRHQAPSVDRATEERNALKRRFGEYVLKPYFARNPTTASEIDKSIEAYYELMTMGFTDDLMRKAVVMYPGSTTERAEYCMEAMKFSKK